jgi:hypothetical protein
MEIRALISLLLVGFALPSLLVGCHETGGAEKEYKVTTRAAIPPIDTYAPQTTETATFALG